MDRKRGFCGYNLGRAWYLVVIGIAVLLGMLNSFLGHANSFIFHLPLFLDTIGTLVSTALFGLIPGLITAFVTHITPDIFPIMAGGYMPWVFCNFASAITLWLFIRRGMFANFLHVIFVSLAVTLANALIGSAVAAFFFSGITEHPVDYMMTGFLSIGQNLISAAFWARIPANLIDKGIAAFIAFGAYRWCQKRQAWTAQL